MRFSATDWSFEARSDRNGPAVFNVRDFGAKGGDSGVPPDPANESKAIQAAIDAALASARRLTGSDRRRRCHILSTRAVSNYRLPADLEKNSIVQAYCCPW
jgi:hypothetical protein